MSRADLPEHLQGVERLYIDADALDFEITRRVRDRLDFLEPKILEPGERPDEAGKPGFGLHLRNYKGAFLRFCPGTRAYRCCGYRIVHIGENCPIGCSYCILRAYFQDRLLKVWVNRGDIFQELERAFSAQPEGRFRLGTGEFTDSLIFEPLTGFSLDLVEFLSRHPNAVLELKSKVIDLSWMSAPNLRPDRVLPAWSLNAPQVYREHEPGAASLEARLQAALECAQAGFRVCLHFDPVVRYPGWEEGYARIVEMIGDYLKPEHIAYISMGSFRGMPELFGEVRRQHPDAKYMYNEYIRGLDGKLRLLRPLRVEQFRFLAQGLQRIGMDSALYFCMESDVVWKSVLGRAPKDIGGLSSYLMRRAFAEEA